jgi:hypothetical protein
MKQISMSLTALQSALHLLNCSGTCLLPQPGYTADESAEAFLRGRDELCENGWAELDFDGKVSSSREFARLTYDIVYAEAAMRLELPDKTQWYLRAPTEMLFIEQKHESMFLERRSGRSLLPWIRETVLTAVAGTLTTLRMEKTRQILLEQSQEGSQERAQELVKHLALFFGKEGDNA